MMLILIAFFMVCFGIAALLCAFVGLLFLIGNLTKILRFLGKTPKQVREERAQNRREIRR